MSSFSVTFVVSASIVHAFDAVVTSTTSFKRLKWIKNAEGWVFFFFCFSTNKMPSPYETFIFLISFIFQIYFLWKSSIAVVQLLILHPSSKNPTTDISIKSSLLNNKLVFSRYFITCSQVSQSLKWRNKEEAWFWNRHHKATESAELLGIRYSFEKPWGEMKELHSSFIQKLRLEKVNLCNIPVFSWVKGKKWLTVTALKQRRNE